MWITMLQSKYLGVGMVSFQTLESPLLELISRNWLKASANSWGPSHLTFTPRKVRYQCSVHLRTVISWTSDKRERACCLLLQLLKFTCFIAHSSCQDLVSWEDSDVLQSILWKDTGETFPLLRNGAGDYHFAVITSFHVTRENLIGPDKGTQC